jgi:hypothetical protein
MRRIGSLAALILVILASLGIVISLVGGWVRTTLFDTDSFTSVVEQSRALLQASGTEEDLPDA